MDIAKSLDSTATATGSSARPASRSRSNGFPLRRLRDRSPHWTDQAGRAAESAGSLLPQALLDKIYDDAFPAEAEHERATETLRRTAVDGTVHKREQLGELLARIPELDRHAAQQRVAYAVAATRHEGTRADAIAAQLRILTRDEHGEKTYRTLLGAALDLRESYPRSIALPALLAAAPSSRIDEVRERVRASLAKQPLPTYLMRPIDETLFRLKTR